MISESESMFEKPKVRRSQVFSLPQKHYEREISFRKIDELLIPGKPSRVLFRDILRVSEH